MNYIIKNTSKQNNNYNENKKKKKINEKRLTYIFSIIIKEWMNETYLNIHFLILILIN